jgi:hypothetical protein
MEVSDQLYAPAALPPGDQPQVLSVWVSVPVSAIGTVNKSMGNYEDFSLLGYEAGSFGRSLSTFLRKLLLTSSFLKMLVTMYQATRSHIPDDSGVHSQRLKISNISRRKSILTKYDTTNTDRGKECQINCNRKWTF